MKKLILITCTCLAAIMALIAQKKDILKPDASLFAQNNEQRFKITVDPRVELINIALTFTNLPYFGKISDEKYNYHHDVIEYFSPHKNHEAIKKCTALPYFQDISFPDQMALYLSDPPRMELKHTPPAQITKQVIDDITQVVNLLNQFAVESKFMKFWDDHRAFYDYIIDQLKNKLPYHEYLKIVNDFYGTETSEFGWIISPILYGAAFGPTLEKEGMRIPFYVTGPDRIENGEPIFTEKWLRLLVFHEYGHSFVNPLCEKYREQVMSRDSLLQYFNNSDVIKNIYDNWFTIVHKHIVRAAENILLKKAGLESESKENLTRNLNHGFFLVPALIIKLEYFDLHRGKYPTFENFFPEMLKVFDESLPLLRKNDSNILSGKDAESGQQVSEI